ncbi:hypothetical protein KUTeg_011646 [Tegillarca granosa]|uniref:FH2 domain-containing protein n=1 Tax=Tegillarca granosa TaxID=220873 RepID=A0ABQ9EZP9_TEGGR|nr:hypothetical protein KUTeg_011646 [Tegillarca granosa]
MVDITDTNFPKPLHNFGIFKKSGKRAILQFDFRNNKLHIIQHGLMKYSYDFEQLLQHESEEGLHLVLKFVNKDFEFDAGSIEEKHTICRLLGMILYGGNLDPISFQASSPVVKGTDKEYTQRRSKSVIKEGILEKKGNTAIPVWAKRLVRVTPGEFSYFRPGEEVALNIIHLWKDDCKIKKHGSSGFAVHLSNRTYYFKVSGEFKRKEKEVMRSDWISAFERACKLKRATVMMFGNEITQPIPVDMDRDFMMNLQPIDNMSPTLMRAVKSRSFDDEFSKDTEFYNRDNTDTDDSIDYSEDDLEDTDLVEDGMRVQNTERPSERRLEENCVPTSDTENDQSVTKSQKPEDRNDIRLSIVTKTEPLPSLTKDRPKPPKQQCFSERQKYVYIPSQPEIPETDNINQTEVSSAPSEDSKPIPLQTEDKVKQQDEEKSTENGITNKLPPDVSEVTKDVSTQRRLSPLIIPVSQVGNNFQIPVPPPPAPPPPLKYKKSIFKSKIMSKSKLKQVHWNSVPKGMIHNSFWYKSPDLTDKINKEQLEMLFSVSDTTTVPQSPGIKKEKQPLIDGKRAQNLSILMKGLETRGTKSLCSILNSVTEDEHFPAEKLTTIRRYQPTQDEVEMYKMYSNRRHELHPVDQFMLQLCEIKCLRIRLDLVLILWDFPRQMACVSETVDNLVKACDQLLRSKSMIAVLLYMLSIGNYMNSRYHKLDKGFQLTSCERFISIRGGDGKYTLLHFLIDQLTASDPQLLDWTKSVSAVKNCQNSSVKALSAEIEVLKNDLNKMKKDLKTLKSELKSSNQDDITFCKNAQKMLTDWEAELDKVTSKCNSAQQKYHNVLDKYGESVFLPSDQFFTSVSRFIEQFDNAKVDCTSTLPIT